MPDAALSKGWRLRAAAVAPGSPGPPWRGIPGWP